LRVSLALAASLLLTFAGTASTLAQDKSRVEFNGHTSLQAGAKAPGGVTDDANVRPNHRGHDEADVHPARNSGAAAVAPAITAAAVAPAITAAAAAPTLPNPHHQHVVPADRSFSGFAGLTHYDQRTAGTGAYANTQLSDVPPDQGLCVGNNRVMEIVNNALAVYDQSGTRLAGPVALAQFFNRKPEIIRSTPVVYGDFLSDPRCYFDSGTRRWFITETQFARDPSTGAFEGPSSIIFAASETSNPVGGYFLYSFDTTDGDGTLPGHPGCPCFGDQPLLGANADGFFISTNEYPINGPGFNGAQVYALSKASLIAGNLPTVVHINAGAIPVPPPDQPNGGIWYSLQPATSPGGGDAGDEDSGAGNEYFLSALQFGPAPFDNRIAVWALTNTGSLASGSPDVKLLHTVITTESYGMAPAPSTFSAEQKRGSTPLRDLLGDVDPRETITANDDRMNQVVYAAGDLWSGVNTSIAAGDDDVPLVGIAWFDVTPSLHHGVLSATIHNQGYVSVNRQNVMFPSIGVNRSGQAAISFSLIGPGYYPTAAYSPIAGGAAGDVRVAGAGVGPNDAFDGYVAEGGANAPVRWGDYSAAVADSDGNIWVAAEYIGQSCKLAQFSLDTTCGGTRTILANWGTFIGKLPLP
jgi:hypothetical protein